MVSSNGPILPNLLIIGAPRCGSTWLHGLIGSHPDAFMSRRKELEFFHRADGRGLDRYARHFAGGAGRKVVGEATPSYLYDATARRRIAAALPDVRLVLILRDPVARLVSHHAHAVRTEGFRGSFEDFIERQPQQIDWGRYAGHLSPWLDRFGPSRVLILILEEPNTRERLGAFLGLDPGAFQTQVAAGFANGRQVPRWPQVSALLTRGARRVRSWGLDGAVETIKRLGGSRLAGRGSLPAPKPGTLARLAAGYAADRGRLEALLGRPIVAWRHAAHAADAAAARPPLARVA